MRDRVTILDKYGCAQVGRGDGVKLLYRVDMMDKIARIDSPNLSINFMNH